MQVTDDSDNIHISAQKNQFQLVKPAKTRSFSLTHISRYFIFALIHGNESDLKPNNV